MRPAPPAPPPPPAEAGEGASGPPPPSHNRADEMRPAALALPSLEVAVRGGSAALARRQHVVVHPDAHRAAGVAPLEAGGGENFVEPFLLRLRLHDARAGHHQD